MQHEFVVPKRIALGLLAFAVHRGRRTHVWVVEAALAICGRFRAVERDISADKQIPSV